MKVSEAIKFLLVAEDKVVIPNFGTLKAVEKKAFLNKETGEILPPTKKIEFVPDEKQDDGKLTKLLAAKNNISEKEAKAQIDDYVNELKAKLDTDKQYRLIDLGTFTKNIANEIKFNQNPNFSLSADTYGLGSVKLQKPQQTVVKKKKKANLLWLWILLPVILIGVLGYFFKDDIKDLFKKQEKPKTTVVQKQQSKPDTVKTVKPNQPSDLDLLRKAGIHYAIIYIGEEYQTYNLISGSYHNKRGALLRANRLKNQGIKASLISKDGYHRVKISSSDDVKQIIKSYQDFVNQTNDEAWVLVNRQK